MLFILEVRHHILDRDSIVKKNLDLPWVVMTKILNIIKKWPVLFAFSFEK